MDIQYKIVNLPQIKMALAAYPTIMTKNLQQAIVKTSFLVHGMATSTVPVRTGFLRRSHNTAPFIGKLRGEINPFANYAFWVHEGTRRMRARPWLRNAVSNSHKQSNAFFEQAVEDTLNTVGRMA